MIADGKLSEIIKAFTEYYNANSKPDTMALFCGRTGYEDEIKQPVTIGKKQI